MVRASARRSTEIPTSRVRHHHNREIHVLRGLPNVASFRSAVEEVRPKHLRPLFPKYRLVAPLPSSRRAGLVVPPGPSHLSGSRATAFMNSFRCRTVLSPEGLQALSGHM